MLLERVLNKGNRIRWKSVRNGWVQYKKRKSVEIKEIGKAEIRKYNLNNQLEKCSAFVQKKKEKAHACVCSSFLKYMDTNYHNFLLPFKIIYPKYEYFIDHQTISA